MQSELDAQRNNCAELKEHMAKLSEQLAAATASNEKHAPPTAVASSAPQGPRTAVDSSAAVHLPLSEDQAVAEANGEDFGLPIVNWDICSPLPAPMPRIPMPDQLV